MDYHILVAMLILVILDFITGLIKAFVTDTYSSKKMREGLTHKFTYLVAVILCMVIEYMSIYLELGYAFCGGMSALVCSWISLTEVGSILENMVIINPALGNNAFMRIFARKEADNGLSAKID